MNSLVRGLPTQSIETILTLEMPCKPHSQNKNVLTSDMTSSIRHQFFEFSLGDRPDFPLSNFKKKSILVLSLLSSFRSGLCTKYSKILTRPIRVRVLGYGSGVRGRKVKSRDCALASDLVKAVMVIHVIEFVTSSGPIMIMASVKCTCMRGHWPSGQAIRCQKLKVSSRLVKPA